MNADEMKRRGRGISDDMSPAAIARRIDIVGDLWRMWQILRNARRIGPVEGQDSDQRQDNVERHDGVAPDSGPRPHTGH